MGSMTNEFELKLTEMKASIELDYLRRVKALEVGVLQRMDSNDHCKGITFFCRKFVVKPVMQLQQLLVLLVTASLQGQTILLLQKTIELDDVCLHLSITAKLQECRRNSFFQSNKLHFITTSDTTGDLRLPEFFQDKHKQIDTLISNKVRDTYFRTLFFPINT